MAAMLVPKSTNIQIEGIMNAFSLFNCALPPTRKDDKTIVHA